MSAKLKSTQATERRWRLWQVETSMACQLECVMCPWKGIRAEASEPLLSDLTWNTLRPWLPEVDTVDFSGGGEPLLQPRLWDWIGEAKASGCTAGFLSNGVLLDDRACSAVLDTGTDRVAISIDGADAQVYEKVRPRASFATVTENVQRLTSKRTGGVPKVAINFVMMPMNVHQLDDMVLLANELGVDQVNFRQCDVARGEHGKGFALFGARLGKAQRRHEKALTRARRLARKLEIATTASSFVPQEMPVCAQDPRDSVFIRCDGKVAPCISQAYGGQSSFLGRQEHVPSVHYGSLSDVDLPTLWGSDTCRRYRKIFQSRVEAHEAELFRSAAESSIFDLEHILESARSAMPEPPLGCHSCHYLYDI